MSVNNIDRERYFSESDDGGGQVVEGDKGGVKLFIAQQEFAKAIKSAVGDFDNPAPRALTRLAFELIALLPSPLDMRNVAVLLNDAPGWLTRVRGIGAEVPGAAGLESIFNFAPIDYGLELRNIMTIGPGHDERKRDAAPTRQQVSLAPIFPPIRGIGSDGFLRQRRFHHGVINTLPLPGNALRVVILGQPGLPQRLKKTGFFPLHQARMDGAGAAKALCRQRLQLGRVRKV